ncbi:MAG: efflux RND transporter periplasmic adaptor subunit [candidate division WOR-3 bacterium]
MRRVWIFIIAGLVVIMIVILNLRLQKQGIEVEAAEVNYGTITTRVEATGTLKAKAQVNISAETIGRVRKIMVREGDIVKKGDLLIELDDEQDKANLILARAKFEQAEMAFNRAQALMDKNLIAREEYEMSRTNYEVARAQYLQAKDKLEKTKINAPISGKIMKINVEEGETVLLGTMNNPGTVLLTIADMSKVIAIVKVDETDVPDIKVGMIANVSADALPDTSFKGTVTKVGLMPIENVLATETAINFEIEIELSEFSLELRPGMTVKAEIITDQKDSVLRIPIQAVGKRKIKGKETNSVFVLKDNKAVLTEIETGISSDTDIEIKSGLSPDDRVITGPYRVITKLKDGTRVKIKKGEEEEKKVSGSMRALRRAIR